MYRLAVSAWALGLRVLSSLWTKWGPALRIIFRAFLHVNIALLMLGIQAMDNLIKIQRMVTNRMDKAIDLIEKLLDIL